MREATVQHVKPKGLIVNPAFEQMMIAPPHNMMFVSGFAPSDFLTSIAAAAVLSVTD